MPSIRESLQSCPQHLLAFRPLPSPPRPSPCPPTRRDAQDVAKVYVHHVTPVVQHDVAVVAVLGLAGGEGVLITQDPQGQKNNIQQPS